MSPLPFALHDTGRCKFFPLFFCHGRKGNAFRRNFSTPRRAFRPLFAPRHVLLGPRPKKFIFRDGARKTKFLRPSQRPRAFSALLSSLLSSLPAVRQPPVTILSVIWSKSCFCSSCATILSVIWAKSCFCSYACLNLAGPSAKGIYFSQGFAKNQIPSAIATPAHTIIIVRNTALISLGHRPSKIIFRAPRPKNQFSTAIATPPRVFCTTFIIAFFMASSLPAVRSRR